MKKKPFPWGILDEVILEIAGPRQDTNLAECSLVDALRGLGPTDDAVSLDNPTPRILQFPVSRNGYTKGA